MNLYPRLACFKDFDRPVLFDLDQVNVELNSLADNHMIEPIDDPMVGCDFWDWADVIGIVDEHCPDEKFWEIVN